MSDPLTSSSVALTEELLHVVKSVAEIPNEPKDINALTVWNSKIKIQSLCDRLLANVMGPLEYTIMTAESCQESQALYFVTSLGIADFIGDGEASLADLSKKAGVEPQFLGVTMNCVIGRGYFEEVGEFGSRLYKNNELSEYLRETHPMSLKSSIGFIGDEGFRASSRLLDAAKVDFTQADKAVDKLPAVNIAFDFPESIFTWMARPEHAWRGKRMGEAMQQLHRSANKNVSDDYPWDKLASPIVDVGGGIGSLEMSLLTCDHNSNLEFIIFDIPGTIENATNAWANQPMSASSRVSFVGGNFMAPTIEESNMPQGKPTYLIRHVLHDWTDDDVVYILGAVRRAMAGKGRLLLVEMLLRADSSRFVRTTSMQLLALNNGVTRTQGEMEGLLTRAGFRVDKVTHMRAVDSVIEATPCLT